MIAGNTMGKNIEISDLITDFSAKSLAHMCTLPGITISMLKGQLHILAANHNAVPITKQR